MTDAPPSAPSAVAPFAFLAGDHPLAERLAEVYDAVLDGAP
jgi:hypothetical protein